MRVIFSSAIARYSNRVIGNRSYKIGYEICTVVNLQNKFVGFSMFEIALIQSPSNVIEIVNVKDLNHAKLGTESSLTE